MTTLRCFSHQPDAPTCHPQRGRLANTGRAEAARQVKPRWWPAVLTLWLAGLQADDAAASHRAAGGTACSIEGARTYASGTSRGAGAVFPAFWTAMASAASPIPDFLLRAFLVDFAGSAPIRPMVKQVSKLLRRPNFGPDRQKEISARQKRLRRMTFESPRAQFWRFFSSSRRRVPGVKMQLTGLARSTSPRLARARWARRRVQ
jgi:hypothetical protein